MSGLLEKFNKMKREKESSLRYLIVKHEEKTQKIAELEALKAEWEEEEKILQEKESAVKWMECFKMAMQGKDLQINQIKIEKLVEIMEQNKDFLIK